MAINHSYVFVFSFWFPSLLISPLLNYFLTFQISSCASSLSGSAFTTKLGSLRYARFSNAFRYSHSSIFGSFFSVSRSSKANSFPYRSARQSSTPRTHCFFILSLSVSHSHICSMLSSASSQILQFQLTYPFLPFLLIFPHLSLAHCSFVNPLIFVLSQ